MDGTPRVQSPVEPGGSFNYQFTLENPGTFWYHPHFDTERQVDLGLYGMLIVYDPSEPQPDERLVLVFDSAAENQPRDGVEDHRISTAMECTGLSTDKKRTRSLSAAEQ